MIKLLHEQFEHAETCFRVAGFTKECWLPLGEMGVLRWGAPAFDWHLTILLWPDRQLSVYKAPLQFQLAAAALIPRLFEVAKKLQNDATVERAAGQLQAALAEITEAPP